MPRRGWKTVGIRDAYHRQLKEKAERDHRSLDGYLEKILLDLKIVESEEEVKTTA